jgi:hypothetical protein
MDKTESTVRNMLTAIEAPLYDVGMYYIRQMLGTVLSNSDLCQKICGVDRLRE